jgi:hypothetical protein
MAGYKIINAATSIKNIEIWPDIRNRSCHVYMYNVQLSFVGRPAQCTAIRIPLPNLKIRFLFSGVMHFDHFIGF